MLSLPMSSPRHASRTTAEWDESFALYNASTDLTQRAFCELHGLSHDGFRYRYRRSELFRGKRRRSSAERAASAAPTPPASPSSSFRPVSTPASVPPTAPGTAASVVVHVPHGISVECLTGADPVIVAALVRELVR